LNSDTEELSVKFFSERIEINDASWTLLANDIRPRAWTRPYSEIPEPHRTTLLNDIADPQELNKNTDDDTPTLVDTLRLKLLFALPKSTCSTKLTVDPLF
jgi:hypothetical protein